MIKKGTYIAIALAWSCFGFSQVKIGGTNGVPNANAMLEVEATNKGFLPPRVALQGTNVATPLQGHLAGITLYNTATTNLNNEYDVTPGYYYNDGTKWVRLLVEAENGTEIENGKVILGGELTKNTIIETGGATNTLAIKDLVNIPDTTELTSEKIVVATGTDGVLKTVDAKRYAPANNTTVYKSKISNSGSILDVDAGGGWQHVNFGNPAADSFQNGNAPIMAANGDLTIQESGIYAIGFYFRHGTGVQLSLLDLTGGGAGIRIVKNGDNLNPVDIKLFSGANISLSDLFNDNGSLELGILSDLSPLGGIGQLILQPLIAPLTTIIQGLTVLIPVADLVEALVGDNVLHLIISTSELNSIYALQAGDVLNFQTRLGGLGVSLLSSSEANLYLYKISEIAE